MPKFKVVYTETILNTYVADEVVALDDGAACESAYNFNHCKFVSTETLSEDLVATEEGVPVKRLETTSTAMQSMEECRRLMAPFIDTLSEDRLRLHLEHHRFRTQPIPEDIASCRTMLLDLRVTSIERAYELGFTGDQAWSQGFAPMG